MKDQGIKTCRWCGKRIGIITCGVYRKAVVDAEAVMVRADPDGEPYMRVDGSKVVGFEVGFDYQGPSEPAYRPHRWSCR